MIITASFMGSAVPQRDRLIIAYGGDQAEAGAWYLTQQLIVIHAKDNLFAGTTGIVHVHVCSLFLFLTVSAAARLARKRTNYSLKKTTFINRI